MNEEYNDIMYRVVFVLVLCSFSSMYADIFNGFSIGDVVMHKENASTYRFEPNSFHDSENMQKWFLNSSNINKFLDYVNPENIPDYEYARKISRRKFLNEGDISVKRTRSHPRYPQPEKIPFEPIAHLWIPLEGRAVSDRFNESKKANELLKNLRGSMAQNNINNTDEDTLVTTILSVMPEVETNDIFEIYKNLTTNVENETDNILNIGQSTTQFETSSDVDFETLTTIDITPVPEPEITTTVTEGHSNLHRVKVLSAMHKKVHGWHIAASFLFCIGAFFFIVTIVGHCYCQKKNPKYHNPVNFKNFKKRSQPKDMDSMP